MTTLEDLCAWAVEKLTIQGEYTIQLPWVVTPQGKWKLTTGHVICPKKRITTWLDPLELKLKMPRVNRIPVWFLTDLYFYRSMNDDRAYFEPPDYYFFYVEKQLVYVVINSWHPEFRRVSNGFKLPRGLSSSLASRIWKGD